MDVVQEAAGRLPQRIGDAHQRALVIRELRGVVQRIGYRRGLPRAVTGNRRCLVEGVGDRNHIPIRIITKGGCVAERIADARHPAKGGLVCESGRHRVRGPGKPGHAGRVAEGIVGVGGLPAERRRLSSQSTVAKVTKRLLFRNRQEGPQ